MLAALKNIVDRRDPLEKFVAGWKPHQYTPDYAQLERKLRHHVFIYNEIMPGYRSYNKIIGAQDMWLGTAFTLAHDLSMVKKNLGDDSFPIVLEGARSVFREHITSSRKLMSMTNLDRQNRGMYVPLGRVKGELFNVPVYRMLELDNYVRNTVEFERRKVRVVLFYFKELIATGTFIRCAYAIDAWMYFGVKSYWEPLLDGGYLFPLANSYPAPQAADVTVKNRLADYYFYDFKDRSASPTMP